jgi:hypothetical protein
MRFLAEIVLLMSVKVLEVGGVEVIVCKEGKVSLEFWQEYFYYWKAPFFRSVRACN